MPWGQRRPKNRIPPGPGQESVWDYPRPPRLEPTPRHLVVEHGGRVIADTRRALRVLETSHPPCYYIPPDDVDLACLEPGDARSFCEFKGSARYWDIRVGERVARNAAWSYPQPSKWFAQVADHLSFYAGLVDACYVDAEQVQAQEGDFYGGWITADVVGPFKGGPGTWGW